ncbi:pseudouridine synthase [Neorhizobium turbinariae]|uniref:pseudouridine synthase n=1 Tax=Neorhizobium turbinariae TaxID=2937795 RepID=UPI0036F27E13
MLKNSRSAAVGVRVTLPRALSKLGFCSRKQAEQLVAGGQVKVNGRVDKSLNSWVDITRDKISVDDVRVAAASKVYLVLNKPRGLVTTRDDPEGRPTVFSCLEAFDVPHLSPVGRLDKASEGLLLFTNDTVFAQRLLDPERHVAKTYHVQVRGSVDSEFLEQMAAGVQHDGEFLRASAVKLLRQGDKNAWIEVELQEGKNRQIRRMLEALGFECLRLVRVRMGDIELGQLAKGKSRPLTEDELTRLREQAGL